MQRPLKTALTALYLPLVLAASPQMDPIANFCRRIYHQSTIANNTLYIDGGLATFIDVDTNGSQSGPITTSHGDLLSIPLSASWDWTTNLTTTVVVPTLSSDLRAPSLSRGALYTGPSNDTRIFTFGGTVIYANATAPADLALSNSMLDGFSAQEGARVWTYDYRNGTAGMMELAGGDAAAGASAAGVGRGYWYNGEVDPRSGAGGWTALEGMVVFDWGAGTARNLSTGEVGGGRVRGEMVYMEGVGEEGVLVLLGGAKREAGVRGDDWRGELVPMDEVWVFDVAAASRLGTPNGKWYRQTATGDVPDARIDFCIVVASAQDGSSHNIYLYGGRTGDGEFFDDLYVLSLPTFTWILISTGTSPRFGHTCHLAPLRQMITVGGGGNTANISADCDWERRGVAVYDLSTLEWGSVYTAGAAAYEVPGKVRDVVGGTGVGGATSVKPVDGFGDGGLEALFDGTEAVATGTSETTDATGGAQETGAAGETVKQGSSSMGAIVGGVVGGVAALAIVGVGVWMLMRRKARKAGDVHVPGDVVEVESAGVVKEDRWMPPYAEIQRGEQTTEMGAGSGVKITEMEGRGY